MGLLIFIGFIVLCYILGKIFTFDDGIPTIFRGFTMFWVFGVVLAFVLFLGAFMWSLI